MSDSREHFVLRKRDEFPQGWCSDPGSARQPNTVYEADSVTYLSQSIAYDFSGGEMPSDLSVC